MRVWDTHKGSKFYPDSRAEKRGARVDGERDMSEDDLAVRDALIEMFPLGLTDDAPARKVAARDNGAEPRTPPVLTAPDPLLLVASRPVNRRQDMTPNQGAATGKSWADRMEAEARERVETIDGQIAEKVAQLAELRRDADVARAILAAIGGAPAPTPEPPAPEPVPEPPVPEPEPPEPEETPAVELTIEQRYGANTAALVEALAEGPLTTKQLRERGVKDVKPTIDNLVEDGLVVFDSRARGADGFAYVRLPDQSLPDGVVSQPTQAERIERRLAAHPATRAVESVARSMGVFTVKRVADAMHPDREPTTGERVNIGNLLKALAEGGIVTRYGPARGKGVYFVHRDYKGEHSAAIAVEEGPPEPEPTPEPPAPEPEAAPEPTEMPPNLAAMPAAKGRGPLAPKVSAARDQRKVYDFVMAHPSAVVTEAARATGLPGGRVGSYLRDLETEGLIRRTGINRRAEGQEVGRAGVEYAPPGTAAAPVAAPEPAPEPPAPAGPAPADEPTLEAVRDVVAKWDGPMTPGAIAMKNEWPLEVTVARLSALEARDVIRNEGVEGAPVYVYNAPTGPGAAHSVQSAASGRAAAPKRGNGKGATVAGTGRGQRVSNADVRALIDAAKRQGCTAEMAANGHWRVITSDGRRLLISNTPRSARTVENDRARLRRLGVKV